MQANRWGFLPRLAIVALFAVPVAAQEQEPTNQDGGIESLTQEGDRSSRLNLRLRDRLLSDVVSRINRLSGVNIIIDPEIDDRVTIDLVDVEWRQALELVAERAGCVVIERTKNVLVVEKPARVFFAFENVDIQKVIDTIGKISGADIVTSSDVVGTVSLRMRDQPWRDALEATVKTAGYIVVEEERGILRIVRREDIEADLVTKSFQLRYVRPRSAYQPFLQSQYVDYLYQRNPNLRLTEVNFSLVDTLQGALTPQVGSLRYFEDKNLLVVTDTKPVVDAIERIVRDIDVEPAQVFIDVRFVTTSNTDILDVGVSPGAEGYTVGLGLGSIPTSLPFDLGAGGFDDGIIADDRRNGLRLDGTAPFGLQIPDAVLGSLDFTGVTATLRLLKQDTSTEILQAPRLIAVDHQIATIFVGETIRYAQASAQQGQAGGIQLVVEEAPDSPVSTGFQLLVVPHVIPGEDKVLMDIIPQSDALSGTGSSALAPAGFDIFEVGSGTGTGSIALPRIASSTIATKVLLSSGQTAVLGGLVTENDTVTETKIPLLGDIPFLGWLFKNESSTKTKSSLMVFVTPSIIRKPEDIDRELYDLINERRERMQNEENAIFGRGAGN